MKNLLLLSLCLILSISTFARNRSIVTSLTAWGVEQQYLADRIAINYMAAASGFDRFNRIETDLENDILAVKKNLTEQNTALLPASLRPSIIKIESVMTALLNFIEREPAASDFGGFVELNTVLSKQIVEMNKALSNYAENEMDMSINNNAWQVALAFHAQIEFSHKAVINYMVTISDKNNTTSKNATFSAIMSFESSLMGLLELLAEDEAHQQYTSSILYDWRVIERQLTNKKSPSRDQINTTLGVLSEINSTTLTYANDYIQQMDNSPSVTN